MTALSFESSPHAHTQIILRYFAVFYVLGFLRDFMSDVFRVDKKVNWPFHAKPYTASRFISSLPTLATR